MAYDVETEIAVAASPGAIWEVLSDFARYPEWNPFILEVDGDVHLGASVRYRFEFPRGLRIWAVARILEFEPPRQLRWTSHALNDAIFRGDHYFEIEPTGEGALFRHGEHFTGALVLPLSPILKFNAPSIYGSLNEALKARVEANDDLVRAPNTMGIVS